MSEKKELTKEQQQNILFGMIVFFGFFYCAYTFGLEPMDKEYAETTRAIKEYKEKILKANGYKKSENKIIDALAVSKAKLNEVLTKMPPEINPMVWSAALIRKTCQSVGIPSNMRTTKSIDRVVRSKKKKDAKVDLFTNYTVEVNLICGFHKVGEFVAAIEKEVPFAFINVISLGKSRDYPDKLNALVTCVFPRLSETGAKAVQGGIKL